MVEDDGANPFLGQGQGQYRAAPASPDDRDIRLLCCHRIACRCMGLLFISIP